jgi:MoaA/NifB/PqqE/SkfB family radical SAM enzyme
LRIERAVIEVNGGCNYSCDMCPQSSPGRSKHFLKKMSVPMFERVVAECAEKGLEVVNLEGSGEATLNRNLPEYIRIVKKYGAKAYIFSNGYRVEGDFMREIVDAGIDLFRFSVIGYDQMSYMTWMNTDAFNRVRNNAFEMQQYINKVGAESVVGSYHLILDDNNIEHEVEQYKNNFVDVVGSAADIWKMHNWSGVYNPDYAREGKKKTCGRPFSPDIVVRAGGLDGKSGAVHPCCQVLGNDEDAVLGHISENTVEEIWYGKEYEALRESHRTGNYTSYCDGCDFLIDDPEVLVWTNADAHTHKMKGTSFNLADYRF